MGAYPSHNGLFAHDNFSTFNMQDGFCEAVCRGMKKGFISEKEYVHLKSAKNLEDVRLNLQETDYGQFLADVSELSTASFKEKAEAKFAKEFQYMRSQANEPLATFLDYVTYEYMITNIIQVLQGSINMADSDNADMALVISKCHPLGTFDQSTMKAISSFEHTPAGIEELIRTVLVATPVGKYFTEAMHKQVGSATMSGGEDVATSFKENSVVILEEGVMKLYLEDFYDFAIKLGGETAEHMGHILKVRADERCINVVNNSLNWSLGKVQSQRETVRKELLPNIGYMYPEGWAEMSGALDKATGGASTGGVASKADLEVVLRKYKDYHDLWEVWEGESKDEDDDDDDTSLEDGWYHYHVAALEDAFYGQCHYAVFYAWLKLKEQEVRNLVWICECVDQDQKAKIDKYIPIFLKDRPLRDWADERHKA